MGSFIINNNVTVKRRYLSIEDVQKEYLPISKKKIRTLIKSYLSVKIIGGRMYIEREEFEKLLSSTEHEKIVLD